MFIRNIMNGKSYVKATMEPYLGNIAELSVDSKETRELIDETNDRSTNVFGALTSFNVFGPLSLIWSILLFL